MDLKSIKKEYSNGELTIIWQPEKCIHSEICIKTLPNVYKPNEKPWIEVSQATTDELKNQISKCPSGALSYHLNAEKEKQADPDTGTGIRVMEKGPLRVTGQLLIEHKDGTVENRSGTTAFCRCGASANKPYCDGSHKGINFDH